MPLPDMATTASSFSTSNVKNRLDNTEVATATQRLPYGNKEVLCGGRRAGIDGESGLMFKAAKSKETPRKMFSGFAALMYFSPNTILEMAPLTGHANTIYSSVNQSRAHPSSLLHGHRGDSQCQYLRSLTRSGYSTFTTFASSVFFYDYGLTETLTPNAQFMSLSDNMILQ